MMRHLRVSVVMPFRAVRKYFSSFFWHFPQSTLKMNFLKACTAVFMVLNGHHGGFLSTYFEIFENFSIGGFGGHFLEIGGKSLSRVFAVYCQFLGPFML